VYLLKDRVKVLVVCNSRTSINFMFTFVNPKKQAYKTDRHREQKLTIKKKQFYK